MISQLFVFGLNTTNPYFVFNKFFVIPTMPPPPQHGHGGGGHGHGPPPHHHGHHGPPPHHHGHHGPPPRRVVCCCTLM
uniref:Uncharacterized protein n=1 Tax=Haematobia irritans TaxID=7368 RepID=A0A1L8EJG1_HAEIR